MTYALLGSIAIVYAVQNAAGWNGQDPFLDIRMGANLPMLVRAGQWDRLVTANFMHALGVYHLHFLLNSMGLWSLGTAMEALLGRARYFVIYAVSCLGGAVASMLANRYVPSLGASTGIVGLFAAIGWVLFRFRNELPPQMRGAIRQWVVLLLLNVVLWVALSDIPIDHYGHAGGFVAGGLATVLLTAGWPPFARGRVRERAVGALAIGFAIVFACGLATSGARYVASTSGDRRVELELLRAARARSSSTSEELNFWAWVTAIDPHANGAMVRVAERTAEEALERLPDDAPPDARSAIVDTLATLEFRAGDLDEAIRLEREAIAADPSPTYLSQLARFLRARVDSDGPIETPAGATPDVHITYEEHSKSGRPEHVVTVRGDAPRGYEAYALALHGDELAGVVYVTAGPRHAGSGRHATDAWPEGTRLAMALVDGAPTPEPDGDRRVVVSRIDPEVAGYPGLVPR